MEQCGCCGPWEVQDEPQNASSSIRVGVLDGSVGHPPSWGQPGFLPSPDESGGDRIRVTSLRNRFPAGGGGAEGGGGRLWRDGKDPAPAQLCGRTARQSRDRASSRRAQRGRTGGSDSAGEALRGRRGTETGCRGITRDAGRSGRVQRHSDRGLGGSPQSQNSLKFVAWCDRILGSSHQQLYLDKG